MYIRFIPGLTTRTLTFQRTPCHENIEDIETGITDFALWPDFRHCWDCTLEYCMFCSTNGICDDTWESANTHWPSDYYHVKVNHETYDLQKKELSAYDLFIKDQRPWVKEQTPNILGCLWKELGEVEKNSYRAKVDPEPPVKRMMLPGKHSAIITVKFPQEAWPCLHYKSQNYVESPTVIQFPLLDHWIYREPHGECYESRMNINALVRNHRRVSI